MIQKQTNEHSNVTTFVRALLQSGFKKLNYHTQ